MQFTFIDPPLPSLARWRGLRAQGAGLSILRALEYEQIAAMPIRGDVLDFGGGRAAYYMERMPTDATVSSVNIDAQFDPTHVVPPGAPLPFADASFDTVLTFNTLEHVEDDAGAVAELFRVMRPGAALLIVVPFLFRVHGHPYDFHRHSPEGWRAMLARTGFAATTLTPLIFGRATTARMVTGRGAKGLREITAHLAGLRDIATARISYAGKSTYSGPRAERVWSQSPGWYIHATKGES